MTPTETLPPALAPLVAKPNWVIWRFLTTNTGKQTKVPYRARSPNIKAKTDDPSSWAPYADAVAANGAADGVGFVLTETDIGAFDIDDCRDPDTGVLKPWAQQKIEAVGSYAEVTPSGTGVRIIGYSKGTPIHRKLKAPDGVTCELYRRATRYITITGNQVGAWPLVNIDEHIDATQAELASARPIEGGHRARQALDDLILLNNPERLRTLVKTGEAPGLTFPSRSEACFYVACELLRAGKPDEVILAVLLDRNNGISEHFYKDGPDHAERKARRTLAAALGRQKRAPPPIFVVNGEIARVVDEAEKALLAAGVPVMVRAGAHFLCRPVVDKRPAADNSQTEVTLLERMSPPSMSYLLNKHAATFVRWDGRSMRWKRVDPPKAVVEMLLAKGDWRLPPVVGVVSAPTLRPNGSVLSEPGYDPETRLWYAPAQGLHLPPILATREAAEASLWRLKDLLSGFPFATDVDRSVALAALMTPVLRGGCDVTPLHLIRATTPGSGKSYLADIASTIVRAQKCPVVTVAESEEEMEKRLGALVLEGVPVISLDNCIHDLGGAMLCQITERPIIRTRILGKSEMPELDWRGTLFANGNNIGVRGDMTRRTIQSNLDPHLEHPEQRTFAFSPVERVMADRGAYVAAVLTIARAYLESGARVECAPIASYEKWSCFVREPLIWLGEDDPVRSMEQARDMDPERAAALTLMTHWRAHLEPNKLYTAREIVQLAGATETRKKIIEVNGQHFETSETVPKAPEFREFLELECGYGGRGRGIDTKKLGLWLKRIHGRIYDGDKIVLGRADTHDKIQRWMLWSDPV